MEVNVLRSLRIDGFKSNTDTNPAMIKTSRQTNRQTWWNTELTLKCKLKCYVKPIKDPLGVRPSKGNQGITGGKEKNSCDLRGNQTHELRIRFTATLSTERQGRTEKVGAI